MRFSRDLMTLWMHIGLILVGQLLLYPVNSQPVGIEVTICVFDEQSSAPLDSAYVEAIVDGSTDWMGITAEDGCVLVAVSMGSVYIEDEILPHRFHVAPPYPNPTSSTVMIPVKAAFPQSVHVQVFDMIGRSVYEEQEVDIYQGQSQITLALDDLPAGMYMYRLQSRESEHTGAIVKVDDVQQAPVAPVAARWPEGHGFASMGNQQFVQFNIEKEGYMPDSLIQDVNHGDQIDILLTAMNDAPPDTSGMIPLNDLGSGTYMGYNGGLYPGGLNTAPATHHQKGLDIANTIQPLDTNGDPDPNGKIILMSVGMSNTTQEFCSQNARPPCDDWTFMGQAAADPDVDTSALVIINGALGGQPASDWDAPDDPNYDRVKADRIESLGLSEQQVQVVWVKQANPRPQIALPDPAADAFVLRNSLADISRALYARYPNLKQVFFSSRIYAGYAEGVSRLNPEPYAYESGFAVKWLIEGQIDQMDGAGVHPDMGDLNYDTTVPWLAWGPYMWANGMTPRSDGLIWVPEDFADDFTHPGQPGEEKVGAMLLSFLKNSSYTACWFLDNGTCE